MSDNGWILAILVVNGLSLGLMGSDKAAAMRRQWRIPEGTLVGLALFGGSLGILLGMFLFHHKTSKPLFVVGIPLIIGIQAVLILQFL